MTALVSASAELNARIQEVVKAADEIAANYFKQQNYSFDPPTHRADYISDKWVRIVTIERGQARSVYAFIALCDNTTKALGQVKTGDIHKPASFKAPAKIARANVFNDDFRKALTPHGIVCLR